MLKPNIFVDKITDITINLLRKQNIKGLLIDIDNTVMDEDHQLLDNILKWVNNVKQNKIKICFVSNTLSHKKRKKIEQYLKTDVIIKAFKPSKRGFKLGLKKLNLNNDKVAVIGDQIFTDIWGGNRMGMYTIYVNPISPGKEGFIVNIKRPIEKILINKYQKEIKNER